jgi:hypothetical protein
MYLHFRLPLLICNTIKKTLNFDWMDGQFKLDRTAFQAGTAEQMDNNVQDWDNATYHERLAAACYLINQLYGTTPQTKLDKTVFEARRR